MVTDGGEHADNQPENGHRDITHDQPDEKAPYLSKKAHPAIPQNHGVAQPADEEAEPENLHRRRVGCQIANGVERPPDEKVVPGNQQCHHADPDDTEDHAPALGIFRVIEQLRKILVNSSRGFDGPFIREGIQAKAVIECQVGRERDDHPHDEGQENAEKKSRPGRAAFGEFGGMKQGRHQGFPDIEKRDLLDHQPEIKGCGGDPTRLEKGEKTVGWSQRQGEIGQPPLTDEARVDQAAA